MLLSHIGKNADGLVVCQCGYLLMYIMRLELAKASKVLAAIPDSRLSIPITSIRTHLDRTCTFT